MILILFVLLLIVIFIKNYLNIEVYTNSCKKKINKQKKFNQCLSDMKKILDNANQKFFLISGTLLGYYREKRSQRSIKEGNVRNSEYTDGKTIIIMTC